MIVIFGLLVITTSCFC
ncbi:MAG: hypothetical protein J7J29_10225 [Psychrobacter sp.]|nr:hypothetical protein [Psychrobacter sp.]